MRVLVYGSSGWIGKQFISLLYKKGIECVIGAARLYNLDNVKTELLNVKPTHVISFIGRTHGQIGEKTFSTIDYLEQPGKLHENIRDNLYSPVSTAILCKELGIHYTYLGTGCIFQSTYTNGVLQGAFSESDEPNFFGSSYSTVKGFTDKLMREICGTSALQLRIRMPITGEPGPRNFITKITTYDKICSIPNSMSVLPELLPLIIKMMESKMVGTINLTNPGAISHNEILEMYREIVDPSFTWRNFTCEEQREILASERSNNLLDTSTLQYLFPEVLSIKDAVRKCLIQYADLIHTPPPINLLITGGCGFIGSNFINYYFPKANERLTTLVNFDAMYYCASETNISDPIRSSKQYIFVKGNLCEADAVASVLTNYNITHVIHFAAQSHVQKSFDDSIQFTYDNVLGTHTLLEQCRRYGKIVKFIHVSTDEVYGESMNNADETHKTEQSVLCPTNPYAATKAGAELIAQSYCHSYKMPIIITRGNNVYGPNQYPEKLIPLFIKLLREDKKVTIQGNGTSVRAFLHAYDTATAFECILEKGKIGEIYNIGCDENMEYSVMEVAKMLIRAIKHTENYDDWIEYVTDRPFNDQRYYISNKKLKDLGWTITKQFDTEINTLLN